MIFVPPLQPFRSTRGVTLIELTIAVALTVIVTSIIYFSWNQLNVYTATQKRRAVLRAECSRITTQISKHLHQAERVVDWNRNSIQIIRAVRNDTITYSYDGTVLYFNKLPITVTTPHASVESFQIENTNPEDPASPYLFICTLKLNNSAGDTTSLQTTILINRSSANNSTEQDFWK